MAGAKVRERVAEALSLVKMEDFANRYPKSVVGGDNSRELPWPEP